MARAVGLWHGLNGVYYGAMPTVIMRKLKKGDLIGNRFKIERKLGAGAAGTVYRCLDTKRGDQKVAVKVLESPQDAARFLREARVMGSVAHKNVIGLVHNGKHEKVFPYIAMELADGGSVRDLLDRQGSLDVSEAAWIAYQAVEGLRSSRSVHRDLKPENLLLARPEGGRTTRIVPGDYDSGATVKVADFGLAKAGTLGDTSLTRSGQIMGTPQYMSPEQCKNTKRVSIKTDIYAIGCILYEMIIGHPPFEASNVYDVMAKQCNEEPKLGRIPKEIRPIIAKCLAKDIGKRYSSLKALQDDLGKVLGVNARVKGGCGGWLFLFALALIIGSGVGIYFFWPQIYNWIKATLG